MKRLYLVRMDELEGGGEAVKKTKSGVQWFLSSCIWHIIDTSDNFESFIVQYAGTVKHLTSRLYSNCKLSSSVVFLTPAIWFIVV